ncbi:hypothetical protein [Bradyrhizobium sp. LA2.1]|uniref:hypothetical protein n=1 Tax=Bradyrhizobium sp. LA2.1 TaxID=3156376 RepID=UPI003392C76A
MTQTPTRAEFLGPFLAAASEPSAVRARILLIGNERDIVQEEIDRALEAVSQAETVGDWSCEILAEGSAILNLAIKYDISLDWLITGDLRALRRMKRPASAW